MWYILPGRSLWLHSIPCFQYGEWRPGDAVHTALPLSDIILLELQRILSLLTILETCQTYQVDQTKQRTPCRSKLLLLEHL